MSNFEEVSFEISAFSNPGSNLANDRKPIWPFIAFSGVFNDKSPIQNLIMMLTCYTF